MKRTVAITDCRISHEMERRLNILGFGVITLPPCPTLPAAVASHTDMLIARLGNEYVSAADYCDVAPWVFTDLCDHIGGTGMRVAFTADVLGGEYPHDCRLNVLVMGKYIFVKADTVSPYIIGRASELGLTVVPVKQGYPACTVLRLDDGHAVTADEGMASAMRAVGIEVTMIENGDISLPPHEYGFIGGCAGVYDGKIYFLGDVKTHRSYAVIERACEKAGLEIISLGSGTLTDLGGILFAEGNL